MGFGPLKQPKAPGHAKPSKLKIQVGPTVEKPGSRLKGAKKPPAR